MLAFSEERSNTPTSFLYFSVMAILFKELLMSANQLLKEESKVRIFCYYLIEIEENL